MPRQSPGEIHYVANNLWRSARPKSVEYIAKANFKRVIDLQSGVYELLHDDQYEFQFPCEFGIEEFNFHFSNVMPPPREKVLAAIGRIVRDEKETLVHCLHGRDRTGYLVAAYRMVVCGWGLRSACEEMMDFGFRGFPYFYWIPSLKQYQKEVAR